MGTATKHPVPDQVKPSFVIFDIRALWRAGLSIRVFTRRTWLYGLCSVLRPRQHSIGYMGDGFLQVKRPNQQYQSTELQRKNQTMQITKYTYAYTIIDKKGYKYKAQQVQ